MNLSPSDAHTTPSSKRLVRDLGQDQLELHASPIKPRRFFSAPSHGKEGKKLLSLHWPVSSMVNPHHLHPPITPTSIQERPSRRLGFPIYCMSVDGGAGGVPLSRDLCMRCGSGGRDRLVHCIACCQTYHWYCAGLTEGRSSKFTCSECTVCSVCGQPEDVSVTSC